MVTKLATWTAAVRELPAAVRTRLAIVTVVAGAQGMRVESR